MALNVTLGKNATFKLLANYSGVKFQWRNNSTNITKDGTNSVLMVINVTKMDEGNYSCIVSFPVGGTITSKKAQLFVCKYNYDTVEPASAVT